MIPPRFRVAVPFALLATGCATAPSTPTLAPARPPAAVATLPAPISSLEGAWEGFYFAYPEASAVTLELRAVGGDRLEGEVHFRPLVEVRNALGRNEGRIALAGRYDPLGRTFDLSPTAWVERPSMMSTPLNWVGVFDGSRPALAGRLEYPGRPDDPTAIYFTLTRPEQAGPLREAMEVRTGRSPLSGLLGRGAADAGTVLQWAEQFTREYPSLDPQHTEFGRLFGPAMFLYADRRFEPFFGKTFDQMGTFERQEVAKRFQDPALAPYGAFARPFNATGTQGTAQTMSAVLALRVMETWERTLQARMADLPPTAQSLQELDAVEAGALSRLDTHWASDRTAFAETIAGARRRIAAPLVATLADQALSGSGDVADARRLAAWPNTHADVLRWAPDPARTAALGRVEARLEEILGPLLAEETAALVELGRGLVAVQRGNAWYRAYAARWGFARGRRVYEEPLDRLRGLRAQHLADAEAPVGSFLEELEREDDVDRLVRELLAVPGDAESAGGRAILRRGEARKAAIEELRRRRAVSAGAAVLAGVAELLRRDARNEGDWFLAALSGFGRDQLIEIAFQNIRPQASPREIEAYGRVIALALDGDLFSAPAWWMSIQRAELLRGLRAANPDLTWEPAALDLVMELASAWANR